MMARLFIWPLRAIVLLIVGLPSATAQVYKLGDRNDIFASARTLAFDLMTVYDGNETGGIPGLLPGPPSEGLGDYYWGQAAHFWATFIDYWSVTGDETYNDLIIQGLLHQVGDSDDFLPFNQTHTLSNDDQCGWGAAAMLAAESRFPSPEGAPEWLSIAQNVFEQLAWRFDREEGGACGGGLRWSVLSQNQGYGFKQTQATGCFLNLAARLARHTGNETYTNYADKSWDWMYNVGFIDDDTWRVYDGSHAELNCTGDSLIKTTFSVAISSIAQGSAFMYNQTQSDVWRNRTSNLTERFLTDFVEDNGAFFELPCERVTGQCKSDMLGFKGLAHRWLASSTQVAPFLREKLLPALRASAQTAVNQCTGGASSRQCGFYWSKGRFIDPEVDATTGLSEQMSVLGAVLSLLIPVADAPALQASADPVGGSDNANGDEDKDEDEDDDESGTRNGSDDGNANNSTPDGGSGAGSLQGARLFGTIAGVCVLGVMAWC